MNTQQILELALKLAGMENTPEDSGIIVEGNNLKKLAIAIDVDAGELLLARELKVDGVICHHPVTGEPTVNFHNVMNRQINRMVKAGVPINKAQKALEEKKEQVGRGHHSLNYDRVASAARLLSMPLMTIHSPLDVLSENFIQNKLDQNLSEESKLEDVINILNEIPEMKASLSKPVIRVGKEQSYAGKVFCVMAGGTNGGAKVAKAYFEAGIGTLVCMHMPDDVIKVIKEQNIGNLIVAGHMACDSIGVNIFADALQNNGIDVIRMGGTICP